MRRTAAKTIPTYFAAFDEMAERIGTTRTNHSAEHDQQKAREKLALYSSSSVNPYLDIAYPREEERRQVYNRFHGIVVFSAVGYFVVLLVLLCYGSPILKAYIPLFVISGNFVAVFRYFIRQRTSFSASRLRGQAMMLAEFAGVKQVPLLVKALHISESRLAIKQKLALLLPLYVQSDEQMLGAKLVAELTRQLQNAMAQVTWSRNAESVEGEAAFVAAVLTYFKQELVQGKAVPKNVLPLLEHFAIAVPNSAVCESQWHLLQTATEECLAYASVRR